MCYYESESKICSKTNISTVNSLHICWNLNVTFTLCQAYSHVSYKSAFFNNKRNRLEYQLNVSYKSQTA